MANKAPEIILANSGDSHCLEPYELFRSNLPPDLVERAPRVEKSGHRETVYADRMDEAWRQHHKWELFGVAPPERVPTAAAV